MSDPTRLGDPDSKSPPSLQRLIDAGRSDVPDRDRLRNLGARLGFGADGLPAGAGAAKGAAGLAGGAAKITAAVLGGIGVGVGALATGHLAKAPPALVTASDVSHAERSPLQPGLDPETTVAAPPNEDPSSPPAVQARLPSSTSGARSHPVATTLAESTVATPAKAGPVATTPAMGSLDPAVISGGAGSLRSPADSPPKDTEFSLLEQAQRALGGDPRRALDLADRDERQFPVGALAQEREVIAIEALAELGRADEARARARSFFQAFPGSVHGPRIAAMTGFDAGLHNP